MKTKLMEVALIIILLYMVVGNIIACTTPVTEYDLTISSAEGGNVTTLGEGTYTYAEGDVVNLVATPDAGYRFVKWTGNVGTVANITAAATTITMSGDYAITAHFALGTLITGVPDISQPPTCTLPYTAPPNTPPTDYCAPMAMVNILLYWDEVKHYSNASDVTGLQQPPDPHTVAEYIGYCMDTNNRGDVLRRNDADGHPGTYAKDISPGAWEFVRWDVAHHLGLAPADGMPAGPGLPAWKLGYNWTVTDDYVTNPKPGNFTFYRREIDAGRPLVVCFSWWNPVSTGINVTDPETGETIDVFKWGDPVTSSTFPNPPEFWNWPLPGLLCIGHAVTGVGYILNWDPDGSGLLPSATYVIIHDNWLTTPENIAIPWVKVGFQIWNSSHAVNTGP